MSKSNAGCGKIGCVGFLCVFGVFVLIALLNGTDPARPRPSPSPTPVGPPPLAVGHEVPLVGACYLAKTPDWNDELAAKQAAEDEMGIAVMMAQQKIELMRPGPRVKILKLFDRMVSVEVLDGEDAGTFGLIPRSAIGTPGSDSPYNR